jgi:hypothetical protein
VDDLVFPERERETQNKHESSHRTKIHQISARLTITRSDRRDPSQRVTATESATGEPLGEN